MRISTPLIVTLPDFTSQSRASKFAMVDLPLPDGPTSAVIEFFFMAKTDMMQNLFILISKCNIVEQDFRLSRLCLSRNMLLAVVGKFRFIQYRFNTIKGSVHNG